MLTVTMGTSCSLANGLDVCDRRLDSERTIAVRNEGDQWFDGANPSAPLPGGGALAVFSSQRPGARDPMISEIRGTLLDNEGRRLPTCDEPEELIYREPEDETDTVQHVDAASVSAPLSDDTEGLLVWRRSIAGSDDSGTYVQQIEGRFIDPRACPFQGRAPFRMSDDLNGMLLSTPTAATLGDHRFVVVWIESVDAPPTRLRARVVEAGAVGPDFLRVINPLDGTPTQGEAVDLVPSGAQFAGVHAIGLPQNRFALVWLATRLTALQVSVRFGIFDDRLQAIVEPTEVWKGKPLPKAPQLLQPAIAFDGTQFLVAWQDADERGVTRVYARFLSEHGEPLDTPGTHGGEPFRLGTAENGSESRVSLTALKEGGFLAAWQEVGAAGHEDASDSGLRLSAYGSTRKRSFLNQACDARDIQLNQQRSGGQIWPSLMTLANGTPLATWTDAGSNEITERGSSSVRSLALTLHELMPFE